MSAFASLLEPASLGPLQLRNRVHMGSLTRNRAQGNVPDELQVEHYRQRAKGGAGLIVTEGVLVVQQG
jgi:2,4-dienoyl-CoA reductase-like NADH-dependent reductase (Old Yellow Enzyme family)